jgi:hypothetical protein
MQGWVFGRVPHPRFESVGLFLFVSGHGFNRAAKPAQRIVIPPAPIFEGNPLAPFTRKIVASRVIADSGPAGRDLLFPALGGQSFSADTVR